MTHRQSSFFAHSGKEADRSDWQSLHEHLEGVAKLASERAAKFNTHEFGRIAGLLHDIGKYSSEFQDRLAGDPTRVDHSTAGAQLAIERLGPKIGTLLAFAIAGHHAGLADGVGTDNGSLEERLKKTLPNYTAWRTEITLPDSVRPPALRPRPDTPWFQFAFLTRMLFSTLVDADYLDTEAYYNRLEKIVTEHCAWPTLSELKIKLDQHLTAFTPDSDVKKLRADILAHARKTANQEQGLFTLTVPTGGGKTLTSLAFALEHAISHGLDRIIYVIPFTSIIEQNSQVFRDAMGEHGNRVVLEHHSAFEWRDDKSGKAEAGAQARAKLQRAMENWDAPIIVTTAVQFFESLFANRPSHCRKLHNIARSVVILDEAQTMPLGLLRPCMLALDELARNYRASVVLCTATQPALTENTADPDRSFKGGFRNVREIAPAALDTIPAFQRVAIAPIGALSDDELVARLKDHPQALCIVNTRAHARGLYDRLADVPGVRHLSTFMCAVHRRQAIAAIRDDLRWKQNCIVISTSLVECGVDVDFPVVYRAMAGIDSIAQAAGRCNREGKRPTTESFVYVFESTDAKPPPELAQYADVAREIIRQYGSNILSHAAIEDYFRKLYWRKEVGSGQSELDKKDILGKLKERANTLLFPFATIARDFQMIESGMAPVIVPYEGEGRRLLKNLHSLPEGVPVGRLARQLQPYTVQIPPPALSRLMAAGAIQAVRPERFGDQFMELLNGDLYRQDVGLTWDDPTYRSIESGIF